MKLIKIPFSIKLYLFFTLILLLLSLLLLDYLYWYFWINIIFYMNSIFILILSINIYFLLKYFNNPIIYSNIIIRFLILFIILNIFAIKFSLFFIIQIVLNIFFLYKISNFKKSLNIHWKNSINSKLNIVNYTNINQLKNIFISYLLVISSLIIFYFSYYNIPTFNLKYIDDTYFENTYKYKDKDITYEDNWIKYVKEYSKYIKNLEYIEDEQIFSDISKWKKIKKNELKLEKINEIDKLRLWINRIISKKAIIDNPKNNYLDLQWFTIMARETIQNSLYYLNKWDNNKWIKYLTDNYILWNMLITSYWWYIPFIVWMSIQNITITELNYILNNYVLDKNSLEYIKNIIISSNDITNSFKNAIKYEYYSINYETSQSDKIAKNWSIIFFTKDYFNYWLKNMYYWNINWNYNLFCNDNVDWKNEILFKKNWLSNMLLSITCITLEWYDDDLINLIIEEKKLLNKIDELLN